MDLVPESNPRGGGPMIRRRIYMAPEKEGRNALSFTHEKRKEEEERDKISGLLDAFVRPRKISATGKLSRE